MNHVSENSTAIRDHVRAHETASAAKNTSMMMCFPGGFALSCAIKENYKKSKFCVDSTGPRRKMRIKPIKKLQRSGKRSDVLKLSK